MKKYLHIEIKEQPENIGDVHKTESYPAQGLYRDKDGNLRIVTSRDVSTFYYGLPDDAVINGNPGTGGMTEDLLLKAIAAASRAEVLK